MPERLHLGSFSAECSSARFHRNLFRRLNVFFERRRMALSVKSVHILVKPVLHSCQSTLSTGQCFSTPSSWPGRRRTHILGDNTKRQCGRNTMQYPLWPSVRLPGLQRRIQLHPAIGCKGRKLRRTTQWIASRYCTAAKNIGKYVFPSITGLPFAHHYREQKSLLLIV